MLAISLQSRSLKCFQRRHLTQTFGFRSPLFDGSFRAITLSSNTPTSTTVITTKSDTALTVSAMNARDIATVIANRLTEKELGCVSKSFLCTLNRPGRAARITTKNRIDTTWINEWFAKLHGDHSAVFYPLQIPPAPFIEVHGTELYTAIQKANKYKNSTFFSNLAEGKEMSAVAKKRSLPPIKESEMQYFINIHVTQIPVSVTAEFTRIIDQYTAEEISEITLKRTLRKVSGIHGGILPIIFQMLGLPFATLSVVTAAEKAKEEQIQSLTLAIEKCNDITRWRREKKAAAKETKTDRRNHVDSIADSLEVSGSHPSSTLLMSDFSIDTELETLKKKKPRTTELRRRSLKSEHCLQITLKCEVVEDYSGDSLGYDDDEYTGMTSQYTDLRNSSYQSDNRSSSSSSSSSRYNRDIDNNAVFSKSNHEDGENDVDNDQSTDEDRVKQDRAAKMKKEALLLQEEWQNTPYKIFMENMALDVTEEDLSKSLRNCGNVSAILFARNNGSGLISSALAPPTDQEYITAAELFNKFGIKSDTRVRSDGKGGVRSVLLPKNPLAVISSVRKRPVKKLVAKVVRSDNGAFLIMDGYEGYSRATMDDMRIFGICVGGQNSRIQSVERMTSIWLETRACISTTNIKKFLNTMLGSNYHFNMENIWANTGAKVEGEYSYDPDPALNSKIMPVFAHLKFANHELAWKAFTLLSAGIEDGAPFRLAWTKTTWYYTVREKSREMMSLNQMLLEDNMFSSQSSLSVIEGNEDGYDFETEEEIRNSEDKNLSEKQIAVEEEEEIDEEEYEIQQENNKYLVERSPTTGEYRHKDKVLLTIAPMQKIENPLTDDIDDEASDGSNNLLHNDNRYNRNTRYSDDVSVKRAIQADDSNYRLDEVGEEEAEAVKEIEMLSSDTSTNSKVDAKSLREAKARARRMTALSAAGMRRERMDSLSYPSSSSSSSAVRPTTFYSSDYGSATHDESAATDKLRG